MNARAMINAHERLKWGEMSQKKYNELYKLFREEASENDVLTFSSYMYWAEARALK